MRISDGAPTDDALLVLPASDRDITAVRSKSLQIAQAILQVSARVLQGFCSTC